MVIDWPTCALIGAGTFPLPPFALNVTVANDVLGWLVTLTVADVVPTPVTLTRTSPVADTNVSP